MCKMHVKLSYWCPSFYNELSIITTSASVFQIARVCWLSRRDLSGPRFADKFGRHKSR